MGIIGESKVGNALFQPHRLPVTDSKCLLNAELKNHQLTNNPVVVTDMQLQVQRLGLQEPSCGLLHAMWDRLYTGE